MLLRVHDAISTADPPQSSCGSISPTVVGATPGLRARRYPLRPCHSLQEQTTRVGSCRSCWSVDDRSINLGTGPRLSTAIPMPTLISHYREAVGSFPQTFSYVRVISSRVTPRLCTRQYLLRPCHSLQEQTTEIDDEHRSSPQGSAHGGTF